MVRNKKVWKNINTLILLGILCTLIGVLFYPIDVINDNEWEVRVNGGTSHYVDETISVDSIYVKLRKADGKATRYLDCRTESGSFLRYELNKADANRRPSLTKQGTAFTFGVPSSVKPIPTKCKVAIDIRYTVFKIFGFSLRTIPEYQESTTFDLLPTSTRPQNGDVTTQSNSTSSTATSNTKTNTTTVTRPGQTNTTTTNNTTNNTTEATPPVCTVNLLGIKINCR